MAISTNSIIHYTQTFGTLTSILKEGFKIKYCNEVLNLKNESSAAAHPMISFCDIPLSDSKQHFNTYGQYGIGLTKAWAMKNGVNPVLYIDKDSLFADSLLELIKERRKATSNLTREQKKIILQIKSYAKNYSGRLVRGKQRYNNYKFYDEREWRLVPSPANINNASFSITSKDYLSDKDFYNDKISACRISFETTDISYIIVEFTTEIPDIIQFLRTEYSGKCTAKELDTMFSKICSTEQIIADY